MMQLVNNAFRTWILVLKSQFLLCYIASADSEFQPRAIIPKLTSQTTDMLLCQPNYQKKKLNINDSINFWFSTNIGILLKWSYT